MFLYFAFANNFIYFAGEGQNLFGFFRINGTYSIATRLMTCTKTYGARSDPVPLFHPPGPSRTVPVASLAETQPGDQLTGMSARAPEPVKFC